MHSLTLVPLPYHPNSECSDASLPLPATIIVGDPKPFSPPLLLPIPHLSFKGYYLGDLVNSSPPHSKYSPATHSKPTTPTNLAPPQATTLFVRIATRTRFHTRTCYYGVHRFLGKRRLLRHCRIFHTITHPLFSDQGTETREIPPSIPMSPPTVSPTKRPTRSMTQPRPLRSSEGA